MTARKSSEEIDLYSAGEKISKTLVLAVTVMAHDILIQPLREKRDIRDYDPSIIKIEFKKMLCSDKSRKRLKQLELWKVITLASYYEKFMDSTRPRHVRQAIVYMRELDAAAYRIDSTIETLDQITNEVDKEIGCWATNFRKSWVTKIDALENGGPYQLSVQLQKQEKAISDVADHFSERMRLISSMDDNFKEHRSLLRKCRAFDIDILAFTKLVHLQCGKMVASVKERWSVEDLKTLPLIIDELNKVIANLNDLRTVCELVAPTSLSKENDIAKLIRQAQKLRRILGISVDGIIIKSPILFVS
ncbi:unnamed protein product [Cercopithifilaria johnstoni]|uniref:Uncharacterized protein n=1 Tax=Cercopithifilaria johnstoni TaxID=2874296 RepID=A0A8J2Q9A4_9BILA|nr:unnamed protein product [Cercopithifilaria johnstoni]